MSIVHLTFFLTSVWSVSASDELNALLSLQNRQGATQQLVEETQIAKLVVDLPTLTEVAVEVTPFTDPPLVPTPEWDLILDGYKCTGQAFGTSTQSMQTTEASQYDCEQLSIQRQHAFYQFRRYPTHGDCVTAETCFDPIVARPWAVYRNDVLWPLKERSQSCSNKAKDIRIASSQMECQRAAMDRVNPNTNAADPATYYTWNAVAKKCQVSKKCKSKPHTANFATFQMPR